MRFICDSCQAQYMISDDKVGAKGAKVRCKKCGHLILVKRAEVAPPEPRTAEVAPASPGDAPVGQSADQTAEKIRHLSAAAILEGVEDEEIGAAFDMALTESDAASGGPVNGAGGSFPEPSFPSPSLQSELGVSAAAAAPQASTPETAGAESCEWFVAIDEKQTGPMGLEKVKQLWDRGEIGPDSLCWRAGLADWKPLSEVTELSSLLAPKPAKPVIIAQAPAPSPSPAAPVESVFTATPKNERTEAPSATPSASPDSGGWRPSAATALASLLQEEMTAIGSKTSGRTTPPPEPIQPSRPISASSPLLQISSVDTPLGITTGPRFGSYTQPRSYKGLVIASIVGGLLIGTTVVVTTLLSRPPPPASVVAVAEKPQPVSNPPAATDAVKTVSPAGQGTVPATPPAVAQAKPAEPKPEGTPGAKPGAASVIASADPERSTGGRHDRGGGRHRPKGAPDDTTPAKAEKPEPDARAVEKPKEAADDEFQKEFGGSGGERSSKPEKKSVYVPPPPGSASADVPESLGQSDIMSVVVQNKSSILTCVSEQKKRDSSSTGRIVMRWQIHPNGKTSNVSCQTDEFKGSPLANCISGLIKSWTFPKHRTQGEPVNFPFTF